MNALTLGIVAHVDAGKTSLTERLLHVAGVIDEVGRVDNGTTQTDSSALERQRGITIRSAVASFTVGDTIVNLVDTPGHPDFIAEVERVLAVLDGAVLVVSAVEGLQPQTRLLMRTLRRLHIPTVVFINKIDRRGAQEATLLAALAAAFGLDVAPMGSVAGLGTPQATFKPFGVLLAQAPEIVDVLTSHDDALLATYVQEETDVDVEHVREALKRQTRAGQVLPVFFGSALTGAGVDALLTALPRVLPASEGDVHGPLEGTVFKVERSSTGERIAYARVFSGAVHTRERLAHHSPAQAHRTRSEKVTGIRVFDRGSTTAVEQLIAGRIGLLSGLNEIRIGDRIGKREDRVEPVFATPTLETVVSPERDADRGALFAALAELADQDPLINLRRDDADGRIAVSLYGEVQKEVIQATLEAEYGIRVAFTTTTTICIERPAGTAAAVETMGAEGNPFLATVGLQVAPGPIGSGLDYRRLGGGGGVLGTMPAAFFTAVEEAVHRTLRRGPRGWLVTDCVVTLTHTGYAPRQSHSHATFDKTMSSTGADFRGLAPLVLMTALRRAGTVVCEPVHRFCLETPADSLGVLLPVLTRLQAVPLQTVPLGRAYVLEGDVPAAQVHELTSLLPSITRGEAILTTTPDRYEPMQEPARGRDASNSESRKRKGALHRAHPRRR